MTTSDSNRSHDEKENDGEKKKKRLILIRHGCTYMNEYLAKPESQWGAPNFTDIFTNNKDSDSDSDDDHYRDSPLSEKGKKQAEDLNEYLKTTEQGQNMMQDIDLVVTSPLRRTMQTLLIGVLPRMNTTPPPSIVALPLASERVYLISDLGHPISTLSQEFPFVDFSNIPNKEEWWFTVKNEPDYVEWRPNKEGQQYACLGEPDDRFYDRMNSLYEWLNNRQEKVICLICHWGVIDCLLDGADFKNCEVRDILFETISKPSRPPYL